jgi:DNA repair exonuclease SbcCD ATPase subunit
MKQAFGLFIIFLLFLPLLSNAQLPNLREAVIQYEKDSYPCIKVTLEPETKAVKEAWEDFMNKKYNVNVKGTGLFTNKDVMTAEKVTLKKISDKQMDLFAEIVEEKDLTSFSLFGRLGYDIPIRPENHPAEYQGLRTLTLEFLNEYLPDYYKERIKEREKQLKDLEKERKDVEKSLADNRKEIEKLEKENRELEQQLKEMENAIQEARKKRDEKEAESKKVLRAIK